MIRALKALFEPLSPGEVDPAKELHRTQLAAAALLIETARADFSQTLTEEAALQELLCSALNLEPAEVSGLVEQATEHLDQATSLYEFTRVINDHYSAEQKLQLVSCMWVVAYVDGDLDKYEEHLIRHVAELTYVPHQDYIRSKLAASEN